MKHKWEKQNSQGFTLAELLIVVAIIAVLVAVSIPIFISRLEHSREVVCENNRKTLVHQIWYERMSDDSFTKEDAQNLIQDSDAYCPSLGPDTHYTLITFDEFIVAVECSEHGGTASGGSDTVLTTGKQFLNNFLDFVKDYSKGSNNLQLDNDKMRKNFYNANEGKWPTLTVNGQDYSIQPFYKKQAPDNISIEERTWLIARTDSSIANGWTVPFVYNVVDGKWYTATKWDGDFGGSDNINQYMSIYELDKGLRTKTENGHLKWQELTDFTESWDKD